MIVAENGIAAHEAVFLYGSLDVRPCLLLSMAVVQTGDRDLRQAIDGGPQAVGGGCKIVPPQPAVALIEQRPEQGNIAPANRDNFGMFPPP